MIAQACHASLGAYRNTNTETVDEWEAAGATKIAVKTDTEDKLMSLLQQARSEGVSTYLVKDAGRTELAPGTVTALGIGPGRDETVNKITKDLSLV